MLHYIYSRSFINVITVMALALAAWGAMPAFVGARRWRWGNLALMLLMTTAILYTALFSRAGGGGAMEQHANCMDIEWDEVQPGGLLFYPGDEHVGIAAGHGWLGRLLAVHCAVGTNGVAISHRNGFETAARPVWYRNEQRAEEIPLPSVFPVWDFRHFSFPHAGHPYLSCIR